MIIGFIKKFLPKNIYSKEFFLYYFLVFCILFFLVYAYTNSNLEFVFYAFILFGVLNIGIYVHKYAQLPEFIVLGITILSFLHILGGNFAINGVRLYDTYFFSGLLRYDSIVHVFGTIIATLVLNVLFFHYALEKTKIVLSLYYLSLFLMALGVGFFNELIEFIAVVFFNAQQGVGDYLNNATDLVFNAIGALVAILMIDSYHRFREKRENFWQRMRDRFQRFP